MKKLYLTTILFNITGCFISIGLLFILGSAFLNCLPVIITCFVIFATSLTITTLDYKRSLKCIKSRQPQYAIKDYKDYFTSQKYDFIICR